jgi:ABC-type antimicrobial peptide transport system permease subunit
MISTFFKSAFRQLNRHRAYAAINAFGLSCALTGAVMIFMLIRFATSFDNWHTDRDRIYRIVTDTTDPESLNKTSGTPLPLGPALRESFPQIEKTAIIFWRPQSLITVIPAGEAQPAKFKEESTVAVVEPEFFDILDFPWVRGHHEVLKEPYTAAITERTAKKYFGDSDPVGRTIRLDNAVDFKIAGIVSDIPSNTDYPFELFLSYATAASAKEVIWGIDATHWGSTTSVTTTLIRLSPAASASELESQLPAFRKKYDNDPRSSHLYRLMPLSEQHFDVVYGTYSPSAVAKSRLVGLGLIGLFLVLTACINFINLATAQAVNRAREIGIRKVLGAGRRQLVLQFLNETLFIVVPSVAIAIGLAEVLMPRLVGLLEWPMNDFNAYDATMIGFIVALTLIVTLVSGIYPGFVLARFQPAVVMKGGNTKPGGFGLRRGLVVLQSAISQVLIIGTLVATLQLNHLRNRDLGFRADAMVTVSLPTQDKQRLERMRTELLRSPAISQVSYSYATAAASKNWNSLIECTRDGEVRYINANMRVADEHYIDIYGLTLLAGRNVMPSDTIKEFIVNETFARQMGFARPEDAVGAMIKFGRFRGHMPIVGVVKDWNTQSLHYDIPPCVITTLLSAYDEANVKIQMSDADKALKRLETAWTAAFPEYVFEYKFLDESIANFYESEQVFSVVVQSFAGVAIVIGCLGLMGLVSFMAEGKTKEIGVRKVLGASVWQILSMFGLEFMKLLSIAFVLAAPVAYIVMSGWLEEFAYRISIGPGVFAGAIGLTMTIALLTVGYRAIRAATANPADALHYE